MSTTPVQTVRADFPHTAYQGAFESATLRSLRIPNRPAQAMETEGVKEVRRPLGGLTSAKLAAVALDEQALQPPVHVVIDLPKLDGGIARCGSTRPSRAAPG